jgi:hypothetical protein
MRASSVSGAALDQEAVMVVMPKLVSARICLPVS